MTFWKTNLPLTSKRVSIILSNPEDAEKLADAARNLKKDKIAASLSLTPETKHKLEEEQRKLKNAS